MDKAYKILLVDDDSILSQMTREYLEAKDLAVQIAETAMEGLEKFKNHAFDLCILDVKMPFKDGFELAEEIRALNQEVPIVFLSGQTEREDRIKGLVVGADDYITKPFSMEELYLRIKVILRRVQAQQKSSEYHNYQLGIFEFDATSRELKQMTGIVKLSAIEAKLLQLFCENQNELVTRELALKRIWGDDQNFRGRSLNVYVSKLRTFFKSDPNIEFLNIHGSGYKMVIKI